MNVREEGEVGLEIGGGVSLKTGKGADALDLEIGAEIERKLRSKQRRFVAFYQWECDVG